MSKLAHILIIDDDTAILEMMKLALEQEGLYHVTTSDIVFERVQDVERLQPDLLLLDFLLQGRQQVWTLLQLLKLHRGTKDIPVILCTAALADVKEQEPTFPQKGISILDKPFDLDELLSLVKQTLASSQAKREQELKR